LVLIVDEIENVGNGEGNVRKEKKQVAYAGEIPNLSKERRKRPQGESIPERYLES